MSYPLPRSNAAASTSTSEPSIATLNQSADQLVPPPSGSTGNATAITATTATLHGSVTPSGEDTQTYFQYGTSSTYGTKTPPTNHGAGQAPSAIAATITGLSATTTYHYQEIIETPTHLLYGSDECFVTNHSQRDKPTATPSPKLVPATEQPR
jgi:hypothetical protein